MITEKKFIDSAAKLRVEVAAVKAVAHVESGGAGFTFQGSDRVPVILFEPHVFWKELQREGINPEKYATKAMTVRVSGRLRVIPVNDPKDPILYPVWVPGLYGPSSDQHRRLEKAVEINRPAALKAASWGRFQILGRNYKLCGFNTVQSFVTAMYTSEDEHLDAFVEYIINTGLSDELRFKDWKGFARGYNGELYYVNKYDKKLENAYKNYSA